MKEDLRKAVGTLGTSGLSLATALVGGLVLARALGPSGRGEVASLVAWATTGLAVGSLGVPQAAVYFASSAPSQRGWLRRVIRAAFPLQVLVGVTVFAGLVAFGLREGRLPASAIVAFFAWVPATIALTSRLGFIQGTGDFMAFNLGRLASEAGPGILIVMAALAEKLSVSMAAWIYTSTVAIGLLWAERAFIRSSNHGVSSESTSSQSAFRSYAGRSLVATLATTGNRGLDILLLSVFAVSASDVGLYAVASTSARALTIVGVSVGMVAFSRASAPDPSTVSLRYLFLGGLGLSLAAAVLLYGAAPFLIPLIYGNMFRAAVDVHRMLLWGAVSLSASRMLGGILSGWGHPGLVTSAEAIGAAVTLAGILILGTDQLGRVAFCASSGFATTAIMELGAVALYRPGGGMVLNRRLRSHRKRSRWNRGR